MTTREPATDFLKGWFVDASPGSGAAVLAKCGDLAASMGISGSTTLTPGGNSTVDNTGVLGDTTLPTLPPSGTTVTRENFPDARIIFDLATHVEEPFCISNLLTGAQAGTMVNSKSFSASWWMPLSDLLSSFLGCLISVVDIVGAADDTIHTEWRMPFTDFPGDDDRSGFDPVHYVMEEASSSDGSVSGIIRLAGNVWEPLDQLAPQSAFPHIYTSWAHIMLMFDGNSLPPRVVVAVNETVVYDGQPTQYDRSAEDEAPADEGSDTGPEVDAGTLPKDQKITIPFSLADFTAGGITYGSRLFGLPDAGGQTRGSYAEVWIAPGQLVDWSIHANRAKFHNSSVAGQCMPCDLGAHGQTPTGSRPAFYLRGNPFQFVYNQATTPPRLLTYVGNPTVSPEPPPQYGL